MSMKKTEGTLALQSAEQIDSTNRLIDSLPYIDDVTEEEKRSIQLMVEDEMRRMDTSAKDYLVVEEGDAAPDKGTSASLYEEDIRRLIDGSGTRKHASSDGVDLERYNLPRPQGEDEDSVEAWEAALDNARAQLEHQKTRIVNLQLLLKHGPVSWRAYNEVLSTLESQVDEELQTLQGDCTHINKERKIEQMSVGSELDTLKSTYFHLVEKNRQLNTALERMM